MPKPPDEFRVGQKVMIKEARDTLADGWREDAGGEINVPGHFNRDMRSYSGRIATIVSLSPKHDHVHAILNPSCDWYWTTHMLKPAVSKFPTNLGTYKKAQ